MSTTSRAKIAALAFGLSLAAVPAFAADDQRGHDRDSQDPAVNQQQQDHHGKGDQDKDRGKHNGSQNQNNGAPPSHTNKADWQNNGNANGNNANDNVRNRNRWQNNGNTNTNNANDNDRNRNRWRDSGRGNADFDSNRDRDRNGNWGNNNNRHNLDFSRFRRNLQSPNRFNIGVYHAPRGYYYRRWRFGERLPIEFYARDFWLTDFIEFGLFAPPPGCIWVRYGPDALLIDEETGEIIQVRYDVFYS